jgi:hypothetical protein
MPDTIAEMPAVGLSKAAADRVAHLRKMEGDESLMLRLTTTCSNITACRWWLTRSAWTYWTAPSSIMLRILLVPRSW